MKHNTFSRIILGGTMFWACTSIAQTVGRVFLLKGDAVTFTDANPKETKVIPNASVQQKDILRTEANSNLEIGFLDATSCKLGPSTELSIEEYTFVRGQQNSTFKASLKKGKATFTTGKMVTDNPEHFKITTPSATVGVRGCLFDLDQEKPDRLIVNVMEVGKANEPSIFVTTHNGVRHEFSAPGRIVIENDRIIETFAGIYPGNGRGRSAPANVQSREEGPVSPLHPPLQQMSGFTLPASDIIQNDKPKPTHNSYY